MQWIKVLHTCCYLTLGTNYAEVFETAILKRETSKETVSI